MIRNVNGQIMLTDAEMAKAVFQYLEAQGSPMSDGYTYNNLTVNPVPKTVRGKRYDWMLSIEPEAAEPVPAGAA